MTLEAALILLVAGLLVRGVPFRVYSRGLGLQASGRNAFRAAPDEVGQAVARAARNLPWNAKCLSQAMGATAMLRRRGHPAVLRLGVRDRDGALQAHAWVTVGVRIVVGGREAASFGEVARFDPDGRARGLK